MSTLFTLSALRRALAMLVAASMVAVTPAAHAQETPGQVLNDERTVELPRGEAVPITQLPGLEQPHEVVGVDRLDPEFATWENGALTVNPAVLPGWESTADFNVMVDGIPRTETVTIRSAPGPTQADRDKKEWPSVEFPRARTAAYVPQGSLTHLELVDGPEWKGYDPDVLTAWNGENGRVYVEPLASAWPGDETFIHVIGTFTDGSRATIELPIRVVEGDALADTQELTLQPAEAVRGVETRVEPHPQVRSYRLAEGVDEQGNPWPGYDKSVFRSVELIDDNVVVLHTRPDVWPTETTVYLVATYTDGSVTSTELPVTVVRGGAQADLAPENLFPKQVVKRGRTTVLPYPEGIVSAELASGESWLGYDPEAFASVEPNAPMDSGEYGLAVTPKRGAWEGAEVSVSLLVKFEDGSIRHETVPVVFDGDGKRPGQILQPGDGSDGTGDTGDEDTDTDVAAASSGSSQGGSSSSAGAPAGVIALILALLTGGIGAWWYFFGR